MTSSDLLPFIPVRLYLKLNGSTCKTVLSYAPHKKMLENRDDFKSFEARVMYLKHDASPYDTLSMDETSLQ